MRSLLLALAHAAPTSSVPLIANSICLMVRHVPVWYEGATAMQWATAALNDLIPANDDGTIRSCSSAMLDAISHAVQAAGSSTGARVGSTTTIGVDAFQLDGAGGQGTHPTSDALWKAIVEFARICRRLQ
eukprot:scaffold95399_cov31-Tisochrysis_lutea.AAC.6